MDDDNDIDDVLWNPYEYKEMDRDDLQKRMDLLVPSNMWVVFQSLTNKEKKEKNPEKFQTEKWYSKDFCIEDLDKDFCQNLFTVLPEETMKLGNAPENIFMPRIENLKSIKLERANPDKPGKPIKLSSDQDNFEIWYKQDDSFEQPFVSIEAQIMTNDCNYTFKTRSKLMS